MELFILRMTPYHERDFIITALSPTGLVSFKASGLSKTTAKFAGIVTLYALIDAELEERKSGLSLINATAISKNYKIISDYGKLSVLNFIGEVALRLLHDQEEISQAFPFIRTAVIGLESEFSPLTLGYIMLAKVIAAGGYGLEVSRCVYCSAKTDIVGINYLEGGFVCRKDFGHEFDQNLSPLALNTIRYAFLVSPELMLTKPFDKDVVQALLEQLVRYYEDSVGLQLKSYPLIRQTFVQPHS